MEWISVDDKYPEGMILFCYENQIHCGYPMDTRLRPVKWKWQCECCGYLDMEELVYGKSTLHVKWWMPAPEIPNED